MSSAAGPVMEAGMAIPMVIGVPCLSPSVCITQKFRKKCFPVTAELQPGYER